MAFSRDWYATLGTSLPRRLRSTRLTGWSPNQTHFYWNIRGSFFYTRAQQKAANFSLTNKTRMAFSDELLVQHFYKAGGDEANRFYCCTAGGWEFLFMYASEMSMPCQIPAVSEFRHRRRSSTRKSQTFHLESSGKLMYSVCAERSAWCFIICIGSCWLTKVKLWYMRGLGGFSTPQGALAVLMCGLWNIEMSIFVQNTDLDKFWGMPQLNFWNMKNWSVQLKTSHQ